MTAFGRVRCSLVVPALVAALPSTASALSLKSMTNAEIVASAGAVIEGEILALAGPARPPGPGENGASVAQVRVLRVYKGPLRAGQTIGLLYWSHAGPGGMPWAAPWTYARGWRGCLVLAARDRGSYAGYIGPRSSRGARWVHVGLFYREQIATPKFLHEAEAWREPERYLADPERQGAALYFLASQKRLTPATLLPFLRAQTPEQVLAACRAAELAPAPQLLPALVDLSLGKRAPSVPPADARTPHDLIKAVEQAIAAVLEIDGVRQQEEWLRYALDAPLSPQTRPHSRLMFNGRRLALRLLHEGRPRQAFRQALLAGLGRRPTIDGLHLLHALDARAAYPLIQSYANSTAAPEGVLAALVNLYATAWAKRWMLKRGRTGSEVQDGQALIAAFRFTRSPVDPRDRIPRDAAHYWSLWLEELLRRCRAELPLFEKNGPDYSAAGIGGYGYWTVFHPASGQVRDIPRAALPRLRLLIQKRRAPVELDPQAPTTWIVDLYTKRNWKGYAQLPAGQLWVAEDGTFGLGGLPGHAWGREPELARTLARLAR